MRVRPSLLCVCVFLDMRVRPSLLCVSLKEKSYFPEREILFNSKHLLVSWYSLKSNQEPTPRLSITDVLSCRVAHWMGNFVPQPSTFKLESSHVILALQLPRRADISPCYGNFVDNLIHVISIRPLIKYGLVDTNLLIDGPCDQQYRVNKGDISMHYGTLVKP